MHNKTRLIIASLILSACVIINFFSTPLIIYQTHGFSGTLISAISELIGSIAIPLGIFLLVVIYKKIRNIKINFESINSFVLMVVIFALINSAGNLINLF
jgi:chromate transport protein ChrA